MKASCAAAVIAAAAFFAGEAEGATVHLLLQRDVSEPVPVQISALRVTGEAEEARYHGV